MSISSNQPFISANSQSIATQYVYSYLGNDKEACFKLLSNDFHATMYRNGKLAFKGGKKEFEAFMSTANFGTMKKCNNISLSASDVSGQPFIKAVSLQFHKFPKRENMVEEIEPNMVKDEINFIVKEEEGKALQISSITHNYFTIYFPNVGPDIH
uniref:Uncharacterized protein n=1 Tax=Marseillevirus LCMAC101 TaxID=2506602 RepID=A0A481YSV4_9VIRU|nr:MAG: hypothetical protein LCMAC101_01610 [Marseillevirus LCMAC101]